MVDFNREVQVGDILRHVGQIRTDEGRVTLYLESEVRRVATRNGDVVVSQERPLRWAAVDARPLSRRQRRRARTTDGELGDAVLSPDVDNLVWNEITAGAGRRLWRNNRRLALDRRA